MTDFTDIRRSDTKVVVTPDPVIAISREGISPE
jgi:hypothetical protein